MRDIVRSALFAAAAMGLTASAAQAAIVLNDNFDSYTNGNLVGQDSWNQTGATATSPIQVAGATDKHAAIGNTGQDAYKAFTDAIPHTDGNTMTTSMTLNVSAALATGDYFVHLSDPVGTTTNFYQRVYAKSTTGGYLLGIAGTSGTPTYGTAVLPFNTDLDVDVDWTFVTGPTNDTFAITVNAVPYLAYTWNNLAQAEPAAVITAANFRQGTASSAPTATIDDLVVDGIVPEPASLGLLAMGMLLGLRRRR
ncbi:MAG: trimeric autotransporter adhesin [Phycisphaerales bacterium]|jgi:hypothetical protein|nr:trimeric autotransporter adhesin [Phycisphaerales bacterium]